MPISFYTQLLLPLFFFLFLFFYDFCALLFSPSFARYGGGALLFNLRALLRVLSLFFELLESGGGLIITRLREEIKTKIDLLVLN